MFVEITLVMCLPFWDFLDNRLRLINFSQTKFVAILLVLLVFFNAIFRTIDFSSDSFSSEKLTFCPEKKPGGYQLAEKFS